MGVVESGFLSIDCGIAEDLNYTDAKTKIFYTSDARFIDTGTNKQISEDYKFQTLPRQYQNVRFFPDGSRNCYTLSPVVKGSRYLVRASFMYGNYDGLNMPPQFDAYVGVNLWNIQLPNNAYHDTLNEILVFTTMEYLSVCLANTGNGTPFISTLELRHLNNLTYQIVNEYQSLELFNRKHF
ncbi:hypothetical protein MRB53_012828 [Persea americana]|uniref:Uncharacterized protein n=1 Tax=Persea americana TaxID=3435 RepID=A0ACC2LYE8_PERAE|nr:hypothetical protein MRB53_012828 [Persea americana]